MKHILTFIALMISMVAYAQYPYLTNIEPNLIPTTKYVQVSETGNNHQYARAGQYKSVTTTAFKTYIGIPTTITESTYNPAFSDSTNLTSVTENGNFSYFRLGNTIHVSGSVTLNPIADSTLTTYEFTLPVVMTDSVSLSQVSGVISNGYTDNVSGRITHSDELNKAKAIFYTGADVGTREWNFVLTYRKE